MRPETQSEPTNAFARLARGKMPFAPRQTLGHLRVIYAMQGQQRQAGGLRIGIRIVAQGARGAVIPTAIAAAPRQQITAAFVMRFFRSEGSAGPPPLSPSFQGENRERGGSDPCGRSGIPGQPSKLMESLVEESAPSIHRRSRNTQPDSRPVCSTVQASARGNDRSLRFQGEATTLAP